MARFSAAAVIAFAVVAAPAGHRGVRRRRAGTRPDLRRGGGRLGASLRVLRRRPPPRLAPPLKRSSSSECFCFRSSSTVVVRVLLSI